MIDFFIEIYFHNNNNNKFYLKKYFKYKKKHVLFSQNIRKKIHETRNSVFFY